MQDKFVFYLDWVVVYYWYIVIVLIVFINFQMGQDIVYYQIYWLVYYDIYCVFIIMFINISDGMCEVRVVYGWYGDQKVVFKIGRVQVSYG